MNKIYTIYKLIGKDRQFAVPIAEIHNKENAENICRRMQKTVMRNERVEYQVNPVFCVKCLHEKNKVVAVKGSIHCQKHLDQEEQKFGQHLGVE